MKIPEGKNSEEYGAGVYSAWRNDGKIEIWMKGTTGAEIRMVYSPSGVKDIIAALQHHVLKTEGMEQFT